MAEGERDPPPSTDPDRGVASRPEEKDGREGDALLRRGSDCETGASEASAGSPSSPPPVYYALSAGSNLLWGMYPVLARQLTARAEPPVPSLQLVVFANLVCLLTTAGEDPKP